VIRLSHEANGLWTKDGLGPDPARYPAWRDTWRRFAAAMRAVPGAEFRFDWTINPGVRPVPFDDYYPGDDAVDIIGVDIYDDWEDERFGPAPADPQARWDVRFAEPTGAGELVAFAAAHDKPLSIPEWGLKAAGHKGGVGDNPSFVRHVVQLIREHDVEYHAYFEKSEQLLLMDAPRSFAVYRNAFGDPACR
jgi:beta-mannanase